MKALLIGNRERFIKFDPHTPFSDTVTKMFLSMEDLRAPLPEDILDADFVAADAIAPVTGDMIARMPNLKLIHSEGVGFDKIDCKAANGRGIPVCNNKGVNADAVAEQTILLMLGLLRKVIVSDAAVRSGKQIEQKEKLMVEGIRELSECRVGLIGFGDIAKAVALRLTAFCCEVFYSSRRPKSREEEERYGVRFLPREELVRTCDIVSLHVPVTTETAGMVDAAFLNAMKPDALLINTARGDLIDNDALCSALCDGTLGGAGLDTIAPEPVSPDHPLLHLPKEAEDRLVFSPHIGGVTSAVFKRAHKNIWKAFEDAANGDIPQNIVTCDR